MQNQIDNDKPPHGEPEFTRYGRPEWFDVGPRRRQLWDNPLFWAFGSMVAILIALVVLFVVLFID